MSDSDNSRDCDAWWSSPDDLSETGVPEAVIEWESEELGLEPSYAGYLKDVVGYKKPTDVQQDTLVEYKKHGMTDMKLLKPSRSGKKSAFLIPVLLEIKNEIDGLLDHPAVLGVVVCPYCFTAMDIASTAAKLAEKLGVTVLLCCEIDGKSSRGFLLDIERGRGHLIVTKIADLQALTTESLRQSPLDPGMEKEFNDTKALAFHYDHRFSFGSILSTVKILVLNEASWMIELMNPKDINYLEMYVFPWLAAGWSLLLTCSTMLQSPYPVSTIRRWQGLRSNPPPTPLIVEITKPFAEIVYRLELLQLGKASCSGKYDAKSHQLSYLDLKEGERTLIICGTRSKTNLAAKFVGEIEGGRDRGNIAICDSNLHKTSLSYEQERFIERDCNIMCTNLASIRGHNLEINSVVFMFLPQTEYGLVKVLKMLVALSRRGSMVDGGRVKMIFGTEDGPLAQELATFFKQHLVLDSSYHRKWEALLDFYKFDEERMNKRAHQLWKARQKKVAAHSTKLTPHDEFLIKGKELLATLELTTEEAHDEELAEYLQLDDENDESVDEAYYE